MHISDKNSSHRKNYSQSILKNQKKELYIQLFICIMISYSLNLICMTMNGIIAKNIEQNVDSSLHYISPLHQYI